MKITPFLAVLVALACGQIIGQNDPERSAPAESLASVGSCDCPEPVCSVTEDEFQDCLLDRDAAVAQLRAAGAELESVVSRPRKTRTIVRTVAAPSVTPKRCGGIGPRIAKVYPVECAEGMLCFDARNQALLASNILRFEEWVRDVQACEGGEERR